MNTLENGIETFFLVIARGQSYRNLLYLLLSFPLGILYFVFLITGISLGVGMLILWIGLLILVGVLAAWYGMAAFERWLAIALLHEDIPAMARENLSGKTLWQQFVLTLKNPVTWKSLVYLLARFPLGIISFVVLVTLGSISISLIAAPFYYQYIPGGMTITIDGINYTPWMIDTLSEAIIVSLIGMLAALVSLHIFNGLAWVSGKFARVMLGNYSAAPAGYAPALSAADQPLPAFQAATSAATDEAAPVASPAVEPTGEAPAAAEQDGETPAAL